MAPYQQQVVGARPVGRQQRGAQQGPGGAAAARVSSAAAGRDVTGLSGIGTTLSARVRRRGTHEAEIAHASQHLVVAVARQNGGVQPEGSGRDQAVDQRSHRFTRASGSRGSRRTVSLPLLQPVVVVAALAARLAERVAGEPAGVTFTRLRISRSGPGPPRWRAALPRAGCSPPDSTGNTSARGAFLSPSTRNVRRAQHATSGGAFPCRRPSSPTPYRNCKSRCCPPTPCFDLLDQPLTSIAQPVTELAEGAVLARRAPASTALPRSAGSAGVVPAPICRTSP